MSSVLLVVLALVMLLPNVEAQGRANLSGTWTMVPERSDSPAQSPPVRSVTLNITQTDSALNIDAKRDGDTSATSYPIEAAPTAAPGSVSAGATRAYWEGSRLVAWRAGNVQGQTVSIKEAFELNPDASELVVETTVVIQHGYTMKGAKNYASAKDVFKKTP